MLLTFFISQLAVATIANPFHKYPYVFLLDVGNEEIEKVNTEQIRISIPGGSLALKYPAIGEGDTIGHVRVSGIDFGTDLKASIVQGGPGYKYVVLVFMGNPGAAYDAVVTIQTVPNTEEIASSMDSSVNQKVEDNQNNIQDTDDSEIKNIYSENTLSMQSSSNIYKYSKEEINNQKLITNDDDDDDDTDDDEEDDDDNNHDEIKKSLNNGDIEVQKQIEPITDERNQHSDFKGDYSVDPSGNHLYNLNDYQYGKYEAFRPIIIGGVRFYPQAALYTQDVYRDDKPIYDQFNHIDDDDDSDSTYKDTNNNNDPNYASPVEY